MLVSFHFNPTPAFPLIAPVWRFSQSGEKTPTSISTACEHAFVPLTRRTLPIASSQVFSASKVGHDPALIARTAQVSFP